MYINSSINMDMRIVWQYVEEKIYIKAQL